MNLYDKASLILTANAYKASKLYALKPTNGSGDLTFTRASAKRRRNASGVLEALANNVPALEYPVGGGCPAWLLEPQSTNLFWPSDPASTSVFINCTFASNDWGIGFTNKAILDNTVSGALVYTSNPTTIQAGVTYTASFYVKILDGSTGTPIFGSGNTSQGYFNFCGTGVTDNNQYRKLSLGNNIWKIEVTGSGVASPNNTGFLRWSGNKIGSIEVTGIQVEAGSFATSYIATTTAAATRVGDSIPVLNNSALFGASSCTWFIHVKNNIAVANDGTHIAGPYIANGTQGLYLATTSAGRLRLWTAAAGAVYQTTADEVKLAVVCNGTTVDVFQNGVKVLSGFSYAFSFNRIGGFAPNIPLHLQGMQLYSSVLTDAECIALTTL